MIYTATILIFVTYSLTNLCEAWLEEIVIDLKNTQLPFYNPLNRKEHSRSLILAVLIMAPYMAVALYLKQYWLIPAILFNRRIFFDFPLALFRGRPAALYEGNDTTGRILAGIFGKRGRIRELALTLVITLGSLFMSLCV